MFSHARFMVIGVSSMQNFLQNNKFFVSVVTLFVIFYSRFKPLFGLNVFLKKKKIDFSLKK